LVVVVPASSGAALTSAAGLARLHRIAIADPEAVPAGVYARAWLESLGLWSALGERLVPTLNVRAALAAVESGNAEAGIVYRTDAALSRRVRIALTVPAGQGRQIVYVLAPLSAWPSSRRSHAARRSAAGWPAAASRSCSPGRRWSWPPPSCPSPSSCARRGPPSKRSTRGWWAWPGRSAARPPRPSSG